MAKGKTGPLQRQVRMFDQSLPQLKEHPTYPAWSRLSQLLASLCSVIDSLVIAIRGDGNGNSGLLNRVTAVENTIEHVASDVSVIKQMLMASLGVDEETTPDQARRSTSEDHPSRRIEDNVTMSDKITKYIIDRILPSIITWAVIGFIGFQIALNNRLIVIPNP